MKRIILAIAAITAIAACTKSEVTYEAPGEIGFAPVTGNITKAGGESGSLDTDQELGIYAFWDDNSELEAVNSVNDYSTYDDNYLVNALFKSKSATSWGGYPNGYPWPVNGALVFAGYTTPGDNVLTTGTNAGNVSYDLASDTMTFTKYDNSSEFDLCWFGRTVNSYNNRENGTAIDVKLYHALSWITIAAYGEDSSIGWTITSMEWKVPTSGTAKCVGTSATWDNLNTPTSATDILVDDTGVNIDHVITAGTTSGSKTTGDIITNNLVIPSEPVEELVINYTFKVNGVDKTDSKTVSLKLNDGNTEDWESGVHYTYTLVFKANEILVAPSYGTWEEPDDKEITVE